jgi:hypothetical protein
VPEENTKPQTPEGTKPQTPEGVNLESVIPESPEPGPSEPAPAGDKRSHGSGKAWITTLFSAVALAFSAFSLWDSRLKQPILRVFVPPVIQYSAPYQNSNFEVIAVPVTIVNEGARTGTVLSLELAVTDPKTGQTKLFYSADFGQWTMERTRNRAYQPFAPISLAGYSSRSDTILFYTRGEEQKPEQIIQELQPYRFTLKLDEAVVDDTFDWLLKRTPTALSFERELRYYDARAFNNGTLPLYAKDWRSTVSGQASQ